MQKLVFTNSRGETLSIQYQKPYILQNLVGISEAPIDLLSTRGYHQDGQTAAGQFYNARSVSFSVACFGANMQDVFLNRRALIKFLSPKESFTVQYENDYMGVKFTSRIDGPPTFQATQETAGFLYQLCTISLLCDDPFLYDVTESRKEFAISTPLFHFPLIFNPTIVFSSLSNKRIIINNIGDIETPVRIQFLGGSTNPIITNETTGEYVKVVKVVATSEILEITTGYGNKKVEIIAADGTRTNAFNYIDTGSTFFNLEIGQNELSYNAESGANSANVLVFYSNRYVGV